MQGIVDNNDAEVVAINVVELVRNASRWCNDYAGCCNLLVGAVAIMASVAATKKEETYYST